MADYSAPRQLRDADPSQISLRRHEWKLNDGTIRRIRRYADIRGSSAGSLAGAGTAAGSQVSPSFASAEG
jgi:hypothetical protein